MMTPRIWAPLALVVLSAMSVLAGQERSGPSGSIIPDPHAPSLSPPLTTGVPDHVHADPVCTFNSTTTIVSPSTLVEYVNSTLIQYFNVTEKTTSVECVTVSTTTTLYFTVDVTETDHATVTNTETDSATITNTATAETTITKTMTSTTTVITTEVNPCPASCSISAATVDVFYWPTNRPYTYPPTYVDPVRGYTYTSPYVYLLIPTAAGTNPAHQTVGPVTTSWLLQLDLDEVSTIVDGNSGSITRQLTLADLGTNCAQQINPTAIATLTDSACDPILAAPRPVSKWANDAGCGACGRFGLFDPPYAIPTVTGGLLPAPATTVAPVPVIATSAAATAAPPPPPPPPPPPAAPAPPPPPPPAASPSPAASPPPPPAAPAPAPPSPPPPPPPPPPPASTTAPAVVSQTSPAVVPTAGASGLESNFALSIAGAGLLLLFLV